MLQAKRVGPPKVEPVTMGSARYEVIHWGRKRGLGQNGGYIAAVNAKSGAELWTLKVYDIKYEDKLETDVQDIFIQTMTKSKTKNALDITDEKGRKYKVDVETRKVSAE
jgi:PQQ enzyme-like repeat protein